MIYDDNLWAEKIWYQDLEIPLQDIKTECLKAKEKDPEGVIKSNMGGWQSNTEKFNFLEEFYKASKPLINHISVEMGLKSSFYIETVESWININQPKDINMPHNHRGNLLSSVFYVESTDMDATVNFIMPNEEVKQYYFQDYLVPSMYSSPQVNYAPIEGRLIIFPGYLKHWVAPSTKRRISIATNYDVVKG